MSDRRRSNATGRTASNRAISRREILRIGGVVIPAGLILPAWITANAQTASTFDFYVSPTGSDSNPGTVAAPWAITSLMNRSINATNQANFAKTTGKRIGFLPGTYNLAAQMQMDSSSGAIQINGGTSANPTYYGSSDASGNYSLGTATLSALTSGGAFGGGLNWPNNGPILAHTQSTPNATGNIVIDGLRFTGYSYKGIRIGGASAGDGPIVTGSVRVANCEFFGQGQNGGETEDNYVSLWLDGLRGGGPYVATNNYFHDNHGQNLLGEEHLVAIQVWQSWGVQITFNTVVTSGSFHGKVDNIQGSTIAYNYIDNSKFTATGGSRCLEDWTGAASSGLTQTTNIHHNVFIWGGWGIATTGTLSYQPWTTPLNIYNNTLIAVNGGPYPSIWAAGSAANARQIQVYNNITTGTGDGSGYKTFRTSPKAIGVWDYNGYMSAASWALIPDTAGIDGGSATLESYSSASQFASGVASNGGVSGCESHSVNNSSPQFTGVNTGLLASQYQLLAGSPFKGAGRTSGTPSGSACDMGAWGGASPPTQIGCNFNSPSSSTPPAVPMAPTLSVS
jgi:hypothetical protein